MIDKKIIILGAIIVLVIVFTIIYIDSQRPTYTFQNLGPHLRGNPAASNFLVEYSDFECPACAAAYQELKKLEEKYQDNLTLEYKHYPLPSHSHAYLAAEASECAADQGKFWEYHDLLFENQENLTKNYLITYAQELNLEMNKFEQCLDSQAASSIISQHIKEGNDLGIKGTPTFFLNGEEVKDWRELDKILTE